jgi:hypothetical protein
VEDCLPKTVYKDRVCFHPTLLEPLAEWKHAKLDIEAAATRSIKSLCKPAPYLECFGLPSFGRLIPECTVYTNCAGNEQTAFRNRYLKATPEMTLDMKTFQRALDDFITELRPHFTGGKSTFSEFMENKKGALGQRYRRAGASLLKDGFVPYRDTKVTPLVKNEKYFEKKPPRLVFSRDPKYQILMGRYSMPLEHALIKMLQVAKGSNFKQRGTKFARLLGEWLVENDFSKFESTQRIQIFELIAEEIFREFYPGDNFVQELLEMSYFKAGHTLKGVKYSFWGCLGSGEIFTGLFNTIFNWVACRYFELKNHFSWSGMFLVDGDDGVIKVPRGCDPINTFKDFGFDAKLLVKTDYHDVEFCSSNFLQIQPGVFYQVQKLEKVLNSIPYMINAQFNEHLGDYYRSLGFMYMTLYKGIPLLESLGRFLNTANSSVVNTKILQKTSYGAFNAFELSSDIGPVDRTMALVDLSMVSGLTIQQIISFEDWFDGNALSFTADHDKPYKCRDRKCKEVPFLPSMVDSVGQSNPQLLKRRPPGLERGLHPPGQSTS